MGTCFSATKISGSNSTTPSTTTATATATATTTTTNRSKAPATTSTGTKNGSNYNYHKTNESHKNHHQEQRNAQQQIKQTNKTSSKRQCTVIPCGKRTDFGYQKDFDKKYTIGKLLGHGQFGYTYVATDKISGDRVAVKKIDKNKVILILGFLILAEFLMFVCLLCL